MNHIRILKKYGKEIAISIGDKTIGIEMPLDAFIASVVSEIGNPTMLLTKAQLVDAISAAADRVILQMKQQTVSVV